MLMNQLQKHYVMACVMSHNNPQRATAIHNEPQQPTANHNDPQQVTTTLSEPQRATRAHSNPQLRHEMGKTHKKLYSLVYAFSLLNPLTTWILIKIVLMLVPRVRSAHRRLRAPGTDAMFRHHSTCGGSIWTFFVRVI